MATKEVLEYPIKIHKGVTYRREFVWQSKAENGTISPISLFGKTVVFKLAKAVEGNDFVLRSGAAATTLGSSVTLAGADNEKWILIISDEETMTFQTKSTRWSAIIENPDGTVDEMILNQPAEIETIYG